MYVYLVNVYVWLVSVHMCVHVSVCIYVFVFETGFLCVVLAVLELTL